jgi:Na+/phosphate symporter
MMYKNILMICVLLLVGNSWANLSDLEKKSNELMEWVTDLVKPEKKPKLKKIIPKKQYAGGEVVLEGKRFGDVQGNIEQEGKAGSLQVYFWSDSLIKLRVLENSEIGESEWRVCHLNDKCSNDKSFELIDLNLRKILHFSFGGVALFLLGILILRQYLSDFGSYRLKKVSSKFSKSHGRVIFGSALLTFIFQSSTSFSFFVLGLVEMGILKASNVVFMTLGADIGATFLGFILQYNPTKNALFIVFIGVVGSFVFKKRKDLRPGWMSLVGLGFLLYGVHLIKNGVSPLSEHPYVTQILSIVQGVGFSEYLILGFLGLFLTLLLQSSTVVLILVIGVAQTSGALSFEMAMAILCGAPLGSSIAMLIFSRKKSDPTKRLAIVSFVYQVIPWITVGVFYRELSGLVMKFVPGDVALAFVKSKIVFPEMALHLSIGFLGYALLSMVLSLCFQKLAWRLTLWWLPEFGNKKNEDSLSNVSLTDECIKEKLCQLIDESQFCIKSICDVKKSAKIRKLYQHKMWEAKSLRLELYQGLELAEKTRLNEAYLNHCLEFVKVHSLTKMLYNQELEMDDLREINADVDQGFKKAQKLMGEFLELNKSLILNSDAFDLSEVQYLEIEMNRLESYMRSKVLRGVSVHFHSGEVIDGVLQMFSLYEQLSNSLYRVCSYYIERGGEFDVD